MFHMFIDTNYLFLKKKMHLNQHGSTEHLIKLPNTVSDAYHNNQVTNTIKQEIYDAAIYDKGKIGYITCWISAGKSLGERS